MNKKIKNKPTKVLLTVLSLCIFFGILFSATPNKVNYQGVLKEKGQLITGTKKMKFSIYDAETGGNLKWSSGVVDVEVKSGVFRYVLDFSNSNLPSDFWYKGKYYLEVEVEGQILSPREEIASGIYAIHAKEAEIAKEAQSVDWSDIKNKPPEFSGGELSANSIGSYHIIDSTITDADISPQANISWSKISKSGSSLGDLGDRDASHLTGILPPDRLSGEYLNNVKVSSAIYADIAGSAALGDNLGNHTATQDLDMGGHDILNVSTITSQSEGIYLATNVFVTQGNVGIGTTGPVVNLQVNGVNATDVSFFRVSDNVGTIFDVGRIGGSAGIYFGGNSNTRFRALGSSLEFVAQADTSADIIFRGRRNTLFQYYDGSSTTEKIRFDLSTGNVGIGTTSPGAKLEVRQAASDTYAVKVSSNDGTAMAVITNQGNVGIGTTNPSQKLTVYKSTAGDLASFGGNSANVPIYLHLSGDSNLNYIGGNVYYNGTNLTIDYTDRNSAFLKFSPGSNPLFSIGYASAGPNPRTETLALSMDNAGNVGIGTAAPSNKLTVDIGSAGPVDSGITIVGNTSSFGDLGLRIKNTGPGGIEWYIDSTNNNSGYGGGKLAFVPGIGSSPAMVLTNTGNVGIGTTGPSGRLHVRSTDTVNCAMRVDNPSGTSIVYVSTSSNVGIGTVSPNRKLVVYGSDASLGLVSTDGYQWDFVNSPSWSPGSFHIWSRNPSDTARLSILSNGNVGIGTTNPTTKLYVNGALYVNGDFTATGTKNFEINHPTKPGKKLVHACIEGPEVAVYYRGEGKLIGGSAIIELPDYFEALTRKEGRTVQLTAKGTKPYLLSASEVKDGKFMVYGTEPDGEFYWEVKAVRADVEPLQVEK